MTESRSYRRMSGVKLQWNKHLRSPDMLSHMFLMAQQGDERSTYRVHYRDPVVKGVISAEQAPWNFQSRCRRSRAPLVSSIGQYRESEVSCTLVLMLLLLPAVELGVTGVEAEPGASLHSRKRLALSLSHGGQGGSLVPPYTRGRISPSRSARAA